MKALAWALSIIFHPLLLLTYLTIIVIWFDPYGFGVNQLMDASSFLLQVGLMTFFMPFVLVLMLKGLGFVESISLKDQKERIAPYLFTGLIYMWLYQNLLNNPDVPIHYTILLLGVTISIFVTFFFNNFFKVSAHTVGMSGFVTALIILFDKFYLSSYAEELWGVTIDGEFLLIASIIFAGLVGTSRLILNAHSMKEVGWGYVFGALSQLIAFAYSLW